MMATPFQAACKVLTTLRSHGHEGWIVGGAVRDHLLGAQPDALSEVDVATSARPEVVQQIFRRTLAVGRAFGVIGVGIGNQWIEVATFRTDGDYADGRHPTAVTFSTAAEDVQRRDFTVNGLLWDPASDEVVDHVGGLADLRDGVVRAIGDPDARLGEDALRMLRAVRFAASGTFRLHPGTAAAIRRQGHRLRLISPERILAELTKVATRPKSRRGDALRLLAETQLWDGVLPWVPASEVETDSHIVDRLQHRTLPLFLSVPLRRALPADATRPRWGQLALSVFEHLRGSTGERNQLACLLADRSCYRQPHPHRTSRLRLAATRPDHAWHEDLLRAECGDSPILQTLADLRAAFGSAPPPPILKGGDLMALGVKPGPRLGWLLRRVRVLQLGGSVSTEEEAIAAIKSWMSRR